MRRAPVSQCGAEATIASMRVLLLATLLPLAVLGTAPLAAAQESKPATPAPAPAPAQTPAPPAVGAPAPAFRLNDHEGRLVAVGGARTDKKWTVVAFYPKAATPG